MTTSITPNTGALNSTVRPDLALYTVEQLARAANDINALYGLIAGLSGGGGAPSGTVATFTTTDATTPHEVLTLTVPNNTFKVVSVTALCVNPADPSDYAYVTGGQFSVWSNASGVLTGGDGVPISEWAIGSALTGLFENAVVVSLVPPNSIATNGLSGGLGGGGPTVASPSANHFTLSYTGFNTTHYNWTFTWSVVASS